MVYINKKEQNYLKSIFRSMSEHEDEGEEKKSRLSLFRKLDIQ